MVKHPEYTQNQPNDQINLNIIYWLGKLTNDCWKIYTP